MSSEIILPEDGQQLSWGEIVESIVSDLREEDQDIPDRVIEAAEMLINGYPAYKVAKEIGVRKETVRGWLTKYPQITNAIAHGQKVLSLYRMGVMQQQFVKAVGVSEKILDMSLYKDLRDVGSVEEALEGPVNTKLTGIVAQHARFVISLFMGQKQDITIGLDEESKELLRGRQDALAYIAEKLGQQEEDEEPIETTYRVIDPASPTGPLFDSSGNPHYGKMGVLDVNTDGVLCHICGERFKQISIHIRTKERMSIEDYETAFILDRGSIKDSAK